MKGLILRYLMFVGVVIFAISCGVTSSLSEGEYLLTQVDIEADKSVPRKERITVEKSRYIRQVPNKRVLGFNFHVWVYQNAHHIKNERINNFMRKVGEEPVLVDTALTERSVQNLQTYLHKRGYFSSSVTCDIDTSTFRPHRAKITYSIEQGPATRIEDVTYRFRDTSLRSIILADTASSLIVRGAIFDESVLEAERNRIATMLNNNGYYDFKANSITYEVDTLGKDHTASVCMVVHPLLMGYNNSNEQIWEDHSLYRLRNIDVYPTYDPMYRSTSGFEKGAMIDTMFFNGLNIIRDLNAPSQLRSIVLRRNIMLYPDQIYNAERVWSTQKELMALGFFRSSKITFTPILDSVKLSERYIDCNIYAAPALKQNMKVEVEASSTSTFHGLSFTLGYSNGNLFRAAETFDIATRFGFEWMRAPDAAKRTAQEIGITAGLSFPRFLVPFRITPGPSVAKRRTRLEFAFDYQNRPYYSRDIFTARWAYSWQQGNRASWVLRPVDINWINVQSVDDRFLNAIDNKYLRTSFESQLNAGLSLSWIYNTQRSDFDQNVTIVRTNLESVGNTLQLLTTAFGDSSQNESYNKILGVRFAQYVRGEASISHKIDLGGKMALAGRLFSGVGVTYGNSKDRSIPFDRMFYCGGANSMRGWVPRTLGPGNKLEVQGATYPSQVGDMRLEANLEYRFPIWWILNGALFFDVGNVWYLRDIENSNPEEVFHFDSFYKQLGFNTGLGLRLDISYVILRFDLGLQLHNPNRPVNERWIRNFHWDNTALNFSVGYPF